MDTDNLDIQRVVVTPELAMQYLQQAFDRQRNIRPHGVARYAGLIRRGTFDEYSLIRFCVVGDQEYLIDGQHRLSAVVKAGISQTLLVQRQTVPDMNAVARIYTMIDKGISRSVRDDMRALGLADEFQLTSTQTNSLAAAVALISSGFRKTDQIALHPDDRVRMMTEYLPAYHKYITATVGAPRIMRKRLSRAATVAVGLVTFRYSALKYSNVHTFWSGVALDDGIAADDPRKYCNRHLLFVGMTGGGASSETFFKIQTPAVSARHIAGYFNAYIEQRDLKQSIRVNDPYKPIVILGSPFDGK